MEEKLVKISDSELKVMEVLWNSKEWMDISSVHQALSGREKWSYNTVGTFMIRLAEKGILSCEKRGRSNFYYPKVTLEEYRTWETKEFLSSVHHGSKKSLIAALYQDELTQQDIDQLMEWLEKR